MEEFFNFLQKNFLFAALAVISGGMLLWQSLRGVVGARGVSPQEATLLLNREDAVVIDVRDAGEWSSGHIPNARHVPLGELEQRLTELRKIKGRPLIVNCQSGSRAAAACRTLKKHGFERVYNLAGGIGAWKNAGLPVSSK